MDFNVFVLGLFIILIFMVLGLVKNKIEWAVFPGLAIIIGIFLHLALLSDGSLTQISGGISVVVASASTATTSVWNYIEWTPTLFTVGAFLIVLSKLSSEFKA